MDNSTVHANVVRFFRESSKMFCRCFRRSEIPTDGSEEQKKFPKFFF